MLLPADAEEASTRASTSSLAHLLFGDKAPPVALRSTASAQGSKRKASEAASQNVVAGVSTSSSTPVAGISVPSEEANPIPAAGGGSGTNGIGSGTDGSGSGTRAGSQGHEDVAANPNPDGPDVIVLDHEDDASPDRKRVKKCTSDVWQYFEKKEAIVVLTQVARDVLVIQVSTVASESAFSAGGRVIDPYRSRLDPEMVEALICIKDWVAAARKDSKNFPTMVANLEVLEAISATLKHDDEEEDGTQFGKRNGDGAESDPDVMDDYGQL